MSVQEENYTAVLVQLSRLDRKISRVISIAEHMGKRSGKKLERLLNDRDELLNTRALLRESQMTR